MEMTEFELQPNYIDAFQTRKRKTFAAQWQCEFQDHMMIDIATKRRCVADYKSGNHSSEKLAFGQLFLAGSPQTIVSRPSDATHYLMANETHAKPIYDTNDIPVHSNFYTHSLQVALTINADQFCANLASIFVVLRAKFDRHVCNLIISYSLLLEKPFYGALCFYPFFPVEYKEVFCNARFEFLYYNYNRLVPAVGKLESISDISLLTDMLHCPELGCMEFTGEQDAARNFSTVIITYTTLKKWNSSYKVRLQNPGNSLLLRFFAVKQTFNTSVSMPERVKLFVDGRLIVDCSVRQLRKKFGWLWLTYYNAPLSHSKKSDCATSAKADDVEISKQIENKTFEKSVFNVANTVDLNNAQCNLYFEPPKDYNVVIAHPHLHGFVVTQKGTFSVM